MSETGGTFYEVQVEALTGSGETGCRHCEVLLHVGCFGLIHALINLSTHTFDFPGTPANV
jgi:hypothetical protein